MPVEIAPLFRREVLAPRIASFEPSDHVQEACARLRRWTDLLNTPEGQSFKETTLLPEWLLDVFQGLLGYRGPADASPGQPVTIWREKHVTVDGKFADAVLGVLEVGQGEQQAKVVVALEGKGPLDPLDRPFAGRKISAVDQGYRYAINLRCDWILVTNMREVRLYSKLRDQRTYERWLLQDLVDDDQELARFVALLSPDRVLGSDGRSPLNELLEASERAEEALTQDYYAEYAKIRREVLGGLLEANLEHSPDTILTATQRLLDRILFVAFAEDRGLVPSELLATAYGHRDPFNPRPIWENFRGVFRAIDSGSEALGVPRYNGGLFAHHPVLDDGLVVPDHVCERLKRLGDFNYGAPDQSAGPVVDVDILGHIFEQSIEDLEAIRAELQGGQTDRKSSKRRREGAFYTPAFLTSYIVQEALSPVIHERFEALRLRHHRQATGTQRRVLEDPRVYNLFDLNQPQREALILFWEAWLQELATIRVLDPACGSGAFLVEAFDQLHALYEDAVERLVDLRGQRSLFDPDRTILHDNLYGVDLNEEAVEIARLSIWIKTAQRGKELADLDRNIRVGNSVVSDPTVAPRAFAWRETFPEVFEQGGFDVVIGNPPYVRAEMLTAIKPYLEEHYGAFHGGADLYVYFYELGLRLLRPGGLLSYVVTNKWLKAGYAEPLRKLFLEKAWVRSVVDMGHARKVFPDADVMPSVIVIQRPTDSAPPPTAEVCVIPRDELEISSLGEQVQRSGFSVPRPRLAAEPWILERPDLEALFQKLSRAGPSLLSYAGTQPFRGVVTGFNQAFIVDAQTRDALIREDESARELLKPCLRGQEIHRWSPDWKGDWLIFARRGIRIEEYPSILRHLEKYREGLEPRPADWSGGEWPGRKPGRYAWFEIQDSIDYWRAFEEPKIVHTDLAWKAEFAFTAKPLYPLNTVYVWPTEDLYLLGVLNSPLLWSYLWRHAQHGKDEVLRLFSEFTTTIPIAQPTAELRDEVAQLVAQLIELKAREQSGVSQLLTWLRHEFGVEKMGNRLSNPVGLDLETFTGEVRTRKPSKKKGLSSAELKRLREEYYQAIPTLQASRAEAQRLELEVSDLVNEAYGLTAAEVALLWETAPPRMPTAPPGELAASAEYMADVDDLPLQERDF
jgi:hypothetical protein